MEDGSGQCDIVAGGVDASGVFKGIYALVLDRCRTHEGFWNWHVSSRISVLERSVACTWQLCTTLDLWSSSQAFDIVIAAFHET